MRRELAAHERHCVPDAFLRRCAARGERHRGECGHINEQGVVGRLAPIAAAGRDVELGAFAGHKDTAESKCKCKYKFDPLTHPPKTSSLHPTYAKESLAIWPC